jgi:hypothetical protein
MSDEDEEDDITDGEDFVFETEVPLGAIVDPSVRAETEGEESSTVGVGQWYWITDVDHSGKSSEWFGCVVHAGSNYFKVKSVGGASVRIHVDEFESVTRREPSPDKVIRARVAQHRAEVAGLMEQVRGVTASLAIAPSPGLGPGASEAGALALRNSGDQDMKGYGSALELAKKETLPKLFEAIREKNESMARWMSAETIPMKAQADGLKSIINKINDRIFSVELYAGLSEQVERIKDGEPARLTEKVRLFQRRCYMDEECLAHYESGGMEYRDLRDFESWLCRPENLSRILPHPRCIVSFKVRRRMKDREIVNPIDIFHASAAIQADESTFLYIRNGEQVFRMRTAIQFGSSLFPDAERSRLRGKIWATEDANPTLVGDDEHKGMVEEHRRKTAEWEADKKAYEAALRTPEARAAAKKRGLKKPDWTCLDHMPGLRHPSMFGPRMDNFVPFDRGTVYFDDIKAKVEGEMKDHNRIALVVQGLLDRSPVLHPHPPWQIWTEAGFNSALELVFDDSRGLGPGDKPDFEAYRSRLNATLKTGSVTVGQQTAWMRAEADKEAERRRGDYRHHGETFTREFYQPYGNPGPGGLAKTLSVSNKGRCTWSWMRDLERSSGKVRASFSCDAKKVLNVDAYRPGDFKIFFADPRTRAEYLKWAPLLLAAEDYHAGVRKASEPAMPTPAKPSSWEGQLKYQRKKRRKFWIGKAVRLTDDITTKGGTVYAAGTLWRVSAGEAGTFSIHGINPDGSNELDAQRCLVRHVRKVGHTDFELDPSIPPEPARQRSPDPKPTPSDDEDDE